MTNPILSNECANRQVILWQYDHAPNLIGLIDGFNQISTDTVTEFWDYFRDKVFNISTADTFGLNVLGRLMGLPRPTVTLKDGSDSDEDPDVVPISDDFYRRLLLGRFFLFGMSPTVPNYNKYLAIIWNGWKGEFITVSDGSGDSDSDSSDERLVPAIDGQPFVLKAAVVDGLDMSMSFPAPDPETATDEETAMHEQHPDLIYFYPAGIRTNAPGESSQKVIGFDGQHLENFADAFSWVENPTPTGGIFAGNDKAKYLDGIEEEGNGNG